MLTEVDYCPLGGGTASDRSVRPTGHLCSRFLWGWRYLPARTTDAQAEHARAEMSAAGWARRANGEVVIYGER